MLKNIPTVTLNLLLINVTLFIVSVVLMQGGTHIDNYLAAHYFNSIYFQPYQVISHMFMHDLMGFRHIFFNMLLLVIFGAHLERLWGARRFFIFYIACGLGAYILYSSVGVFEIVQLKNQITSSGIDLGMIDIAIDEQTIYPMMEPQYFPELLKINIRDHNLPQEVLQQSDAIYRYMDLNLGKMAGASGALFGVLAAFMLLFPNTELYLLFIPIPIKAKYLIGGYLAFEIYNSLKMPDDHIAHLAHVGGAIVGITIVLIRRKSDRKNFW